MEWYLSQVCLISRNENLFLLWFNFWPWQRLKTGECATTPDFEFGADAAHKPKLKLPTQERRGKLSRVEEGGRREVWLNNCGTMLMGLGILGSSRAKKRFGQRRLRLPFEKSEEAKIARRGGFFLCIQGANGPFSR